MADVLGALEHAEGQAGQEVPGGQQAGHGPQLEAGPLCKGGGGAVSAGGAAGWPPQALPPGPPQRRTLQEAGDVLQLGDAVLPVPAEVLQQLESLQVFPARVGGVEAPQRGVDLLPVGGGGGAQAGRVPPTPNLAPRRLPQTPPGIRQPLPWALCSAPCRPQAASHCRPLPGPKDTGHWEWMSPTCSFGGFQGTVGGLGKSLLHLHLVCPLEATTLHSGVLGVFPGPPHSPPCLSPAAIMGSHQVAVSSAVYSTWGIGSPLGRGSAVSPGPLGEGVWGMDRKGLG